MYMYIGVLHLALSCSESITEVYVDGNSEGNPGDYQFYNDDDSAYIEWLPGEPNGANEYCINMHTNPRMGINNIPCSYKYQALCEYESKLAVRRHREYTVDSIQNLFLAAFLTSSGSCRLDIGDLDTTQHCYFAPPQITVEAGLMQTLCPVGSHLATISSQEEDEFVGTIAGDTKLFFKKK